MVHRLTPIVTFILLAATPCSSAFIGNIAISMRLHVYMHTMPGFKINDWSLAKIALAAFQGISDHRLHGLHGFFDRFLRFFRENLCDLNGGLAACIRQIVGVAVGRP